MINWCILVLLLVIFTLYFSFIAWISKHQHWKIQQALSSVIPPACVLQEYLFYSFYLGILMEKYNYHTATHSFLWLSCIFRGLEIALILLVFALYKMPSSFSKNLSECNTGENRQTEWTGERNTRKACCGVGECDCCNPCKQQAKENLL